MNEIFNTPIKIIILILMICALILIGVTVGIVISENGDNDNQTKTIEKQDNYLDKPIKEATVGDVILYRLIFG